MLVANVRLGYLISQYPAINHTFVLREVQTLRTLGFELVTVSIRPSDRPPGLLSAEESAENAGTFSVLGAGVGHAVWANLRTLATRPLRFIRGLGFAWSLGRGAPALWVSHTLYFFEAIVAGAYFTRRRIPHVHTHFSSTVALIMCRVFPLRYSITVHGSGEFNDVIGFHMAEKVASATLIVTISHYGSSQVMRASEPQYWSKVKTFRLGVDPAAFLPRAVRTRIPGEPFRLIFVGGLGPAKGLHVLIETVDLLRERSRRIELLIVGEGPARRSLEELIRERGLDAEVRLFGACNHDRIADLYDRSDAFVLASFAEGLPVVLMEAMAMQLPCVSTWITGIPELIESGKNGLLVPPAQPVAIAEAVERLIDDPEFARRLGAAARDTIVSRYDLARNVEQLAEAFSTMSVGR